MPLRPMLSKPVTEKRAKALVLSETKGDFLELYTVAAPLGLAYRSLTEADY